MEFVTVLSGWMMSMLKKEPCHPLNELNNCSCKYPSAGLEYPPLKVTVSNGASPQIGSIVKSGMVEDVPEMTNVRLPSQPPSSTTVTWYTPAVTSAEMPLSETTSPPPPFQSATQM